MDEKWIEELTGGVRKKVNEILNVGIEIGLTNSKLMSRSNSLKQHIDNLLNDMLHEECQHKLEIETSIENLKKEIKTLCSDLMIDYSHSESNESLIEKESHLLNKRDELRVIKDKRMKDFHYLLQLENDLCERLFEYKLELDRELIPNEYQLDALRHQIDKLKNIKEKRMENFLSERKTILRYFTLLGKSPPNDALIESIISDENGTDVPLSLEYMKHCERLVIELQTEYGENVKECKKLRNRYEMLHKTLFSSESTEFEDFLCKHSQQFDYNTLNMIKQNVKHLEECRMEKIGEFGKKYQNQIREKLRKNFHCYLEENENYEFLLFAEDISESMLETLETELEKWIFIDAELQPLQEEMKTLDVLFNKLNDINANLKNPIVLKNRGGILLKYEKEKNLTKKDLRKCESKIRVILSSLKKEIINCNDLKKRGMRLDDYIVYMWEQVEGEKENERKEKQNRINNSKIDMSKSSNLQKKPLQSTQKNQVSAKQMSARTKCKQQDLSKEQTKIPLKQNMPSPFPKMLVTNLNRRYSKSHNCLNMKASTKIPIGSTVNNYDLFCVIPHQQF